MSLGFARVDPPSGPSFARTSGKKSEIAQLVLAVLASVIVMWFSRLREFRADAGGARLAGTGKMVAALERLKAGTEPLPDQLVAFGISGGRAGGLRRLFSAHPSLDERIASPCCFR